MSFLMELFEFLTRNNISSGEEWNEVVILDTSEAVVLKILRGSSYASLKCLKTQSFHTEQCRSDVGPQIDMLKIADSIERKHRNIALTDLSGIDCWTFDKQETSVKKKLMH